jgi:hypothetical protein
MFHMEPSDDERFHGEKDDKVPTTEYSCGE